MVQKNSKEYWNLMPTNSRTLNICLHNIVDKESDIQTIYDLTRKQLVNLQELLDRLRGGGIFAMYELFFDDGYKSFVNLTKDHKFSIPKKFIHTAVIIEKLGTEGYMTPDDVQDTYEAGFSVCSHGVNHSALAIFDGDSLQTTPTRGAYRSSPYEKGKVLRSSEVEYQLAESSHYIELLTGEKPNFFVFPYGLYNEQAVFIASVSSSYAKLYTCDKAFDTGQFLSPRLLVTQENVERIEDEIMSLTDKFTPLPQQV